jgi:hypothetical protein
MGTGPPFDPVSGARETPAIWDPDLVPAVVTLVLAPTGFGRGAALPALRPLAEYREAAARHLVFDLGGARHRVRIMGNPADVPLCVLLAPDGRGFAEAGLLARALAGEAASGAPFQRSRFRRDQLGAMLDIVDAADTGATLRQIAVATLFPWLKLDATEWKTSTERRRIQRLLVAGRQMVEGGYRRLIEG